MSPLYCNKENTVLPWRG